MSPIAHSGLALLGWQHTAQPKNIKTLALFLVIANIPDIDYLFFLVLGKRAFSMHQFYTHNVFFVLIAALCCLPFLSTRSKTARGVGAAKEGVGAAKEGVGAAHYIGFLLVGYSHLVLDLFTIDPAPPRGFRMFYPFSDQLYNAGLLPNLHKAHMGEVFSLYNLAVLSFEAAVFLLPVLLIYRKQFLSHIQREEFLKP